MNITIIIVTWNSEGVIRNCMDSIIQNTGERQPEIILVDNNSSDQTVKIVAEHYPRVNLIRNKDNLGYAEANNQGIEKSRGEYLLLLNPDTEVRENSLISMIQFMEENPRTGALGPQLLNPDGTVQPSCREFPTYATLLWEFSGLSRLFPKSKIFGHWRMGYFNFDRIREVDQPMGSCLLLRRRTLEEVGVFDRSFPMFFNDVDLCYRIKKTEWKIYFFPDAQILHHKGASTRQVKRRMIWRSHLAFYRFFRKHKNGMLNHLIQYLFCIPLFLFAFARMILKK
ncbi:MAG: glycosyltransferase family 2 protein [Candidatus Zixiibacteriota bacterium]